MDRSIAVWYVQLFGGLQAVSPTGWSISRFRSHKVGALLAYLALFPKHPHSREQLAEMLWPESEGARVNLRTVLSSLRRELEPEGVPAGSVLVTRGHTDVSLVSCATETDVARFETLLKAADRAGLSAEEAITQLTDAIACYTGPLLPGFYEDWIVSERYRTTTLYRNALGRLSRLYEEIGNLAHALESARRVVEDEPLAEEAQANLIRLYIAAGDRGGALRQYQDLVRLLKEQWGIDPGAEVRALIGTLREGTYAPANHATEHQERTEFLGEPKTQRDRLSQQNVAGSIHRGVQLPATFTTFHGREEESRQVAELLRSEQVRLLTITGPGGSGKTRLSIKVARDVVNFFVGGVLFVSLADLREPQRLPEAIADVLGLARSEATILPEQIAGALNAVAAPILLVLDNFEQIVEEGARLVQTLLGEVPPLTCLVTSRHRLLVEAEHEFTLAPLPIPEHSDTPQQLLQCPSVQLFVSRARAARGDFELTSQNAAAVSELCTGLEGIPLALELAAAWAQALTPEQMRKRLRNRFDLLVARRRDAVSRHATLRATIAWGIDLLSPHLRDFFVRLSVFHGGFSLEAAEQVCAEPQALTFLADLRDHSLLIAEQPNTAMEEIAETGVLQPAMRYRLLETIREFAEEQQKQWDNEARTLLQAQHAAYFLKEVETAEPHLSGSAQQHFWLEHLQTEHANLRAALEWTRDSAKRGSAEAYSMYLQLCSALWSFWFLRGHLAEAAQWLLQDDILQYTEGMAGIPPRIRARFLFARAEIAYLRESQKQFVQAMEQALMLYREAGDKSGEGRALARLAHWNQDIPYDERRRMARSARRLCRATGDSHAEATVLTDQAWLIRLQNKNYPRAYKFMARAVALYRAAGDTEHVISALREMGTWHTWALEIDRALPLLGEALVLARRQNNRLEIGYLLWILGYAMDFSNNPPRTVELYREGIQVAQSIGDGWCYLLNLVRYGLTLLEEGEDDVAEAVFRESLPRARRASERMQAFRLPELYLTIEGLAIVAAQRGDLHRAARLLGITWAMGRPGPDERPHDYAPSVYKRYQAMRTAIAEEPDGLLAEWEWGRALPAAEADRFVLGDSLG